MTVTRTFGKQKWGAVVPFVGPHDRPDLSLKNRPKLSQGQANAARVFDYMHNGDLKLPYLDNGLTTNLNNPDYAAKLRSTTSSFTPRQPNKNFTSARDVTPVELTSSQQEALAQYKANLAGGFPQISKSNYAGTYTNNAVPDAAVPKKRIETLDEPRLFDISPEEPSTAYLAGANNAPIHEYRLGRPKLEEDLPTGDALNKYTQILKQRWDEKLASTPIPLSTNPNLTGWGESFDSQPWTQTVPLGAINYHSKGFPNDLYHYGFDTRGLFPIKENAEAQATRRLAAEILDTRLDRKPEYILDQSTWSSDLAGQKYRNRMQRSAPTLGQLAERYGATNSYELLLQSVDPSLFSWAKVARQVPLSKEKVTAIKQQMYETALALQSQLSATGNPLAKRIGDDVVTLVEDRNRALSQVEFVRKFSSLGSTQEKQLFVLGELHRNYPSVDGDGNSIPKDHPLENAEIRAYVSHTLQGSSFDAEYRKRRFPESSK